MSTTSTEQVHEDESAEDCVEFAHVSRGRDSIPIVSLGIAAGVAVIVLVLYVFPPPVPAPLVKTDGFAQRQ